MKQFILTMIAIFAFSSTTLYAQDKKERTSKERPSMEELINIRVSRMQNRMALDDKTAAEFAPLYKEYIQAIKDCHMSNQCPVQNDQQLTDADRIKRLENRFECRQKMLDIQKSYYTKFKKILNARQLECVFGHKQHKSTRNGCHNSHRGGKERGGRHAYRAICPANPTQAQ